MDENLKSLLLIVGSLAGLAIIGNYFMTGKISVLGEIGKMSIAARKFISRKIRKLRHEGKKGRQSIKIAYELARKKGYSIPAVP